MRAGDMPDCHDVLGVGFGPANLALAIAFAEDLPDVTTRFLEAQHDPVWQGGMMLDGVNVQNHPSRDLVTLRNPRSRYSFLNYLFEQGRLVEHLNLPVEFPLRKEYAQYIRWATAQFAHVARFGTRVAEIAADTWRGQPVHVVRTHDGGEELARTLVVGTGRTPYVPEQFASAVRSPRVFHLTEYLQRVRELSEPRRIAVIGGSQSAVEITLDLARRFPGARVVDYVRAFGLRLKDTSPFSEEGYFPEFTEYYFNASRTGKRALDAYMRPTNYSSTDDDVLKELYLLIYEQRLDGDQRVFVRGNREVRAATVRDDSVLLEVEEVHTGVVETDEVDAVVLATGFRDLGPGPGQEPYPALLSGIADRFRFDDDGYLEVNADYSVTPVHPATAPLYLNGLCESTHGIGDAGSFSLLSLRAVAIRDGVRKHLGEKGKT
ncbi:lysine N(6)-hydroxylase/L-ornithine N(5)-oxygenase family protein [Lentzea sp.]|uniref:lysine N(6)-hydroxylase/L-ornithine N(5)-oxygenase family protein n=1 Tax=Lentzea sp. TaxID=56099 RepID=UPI002BA1BC64|nr:SidA/IucD/PvdA family monooxygenase [Lentzea sp.]HUQ56477.1 SidA/IucD/PvdA family monooxygenase [Lentzea sp.]